MLCRYTRVDAEDIKYTQPQDENSTSKPLIRAATLFKLVEKLTCPKYQGNSTLFFQCCFFMKDFLSYVSVGCADAELVNQFLITYHTFSTPEEVLTLLIQRFDIPTPPQLTPDRIKQFENDERLPIRLRYLRIVFLNFSIIKTG